MIVMASHYPMGQTFEDLIASKRKNDRKAYIPACPYLGLPYFKEPEDNGIFKPLFNILKKKMFPRCDEHTFYLDRPINEDYLFSHGIIEIGGGNTFELLEMFRESNIIEKLREYERDGGIIVGCSAGAVVLGATTLLSTIADYNKNDITDFTGLNLTEKFGHICFKPHADMYRNHDVLFQAFADSHNINVITGTESAYVIFDDEVYYTNGVNFYAPNSKES